MVGRFLVQVRLWVFRYCVDGKETRVGQGPRFMSQLKFRLAGCALAFALTSWRLAFWFRTTELLGF